MNDIGKPVAVKALVALSLLMLLAGIAILGIDLYPRYLNLNLSELQDCDRSHPVCGLGEAAVNLAIVAVLAVTAALIVYPSLLLLIVFIRRRLVSIVLNCFLMLVVAVVSIFMAINVATGDLPIAPGILWFAVLWVPLALMFVPATLSYVGFYKGQRLTVRSRADAQ